MSIRHFDRGIIVADGSYLLSTRSRAVVMIASHIDINVEHIKLLRRVGRVR